MATRKKRKHLAIARKWIRFGRGIAGREFRRLIGKADSLELVSVNGYQLYISRDDLGSVAESLRLKGSYETGITACFEDIVKPGMVVLDIGANLGYYTVLFSKLVGPSGEVFAFEPDATNYRVLSENIKLNNCDNVTALNLALSDRSGEQEFFTDKTHFGVHSLARENLIHVAAGHTVPTLTLDDFAARHLQGRKADVIKSDTQGAEGTVFSHSDAILGSDNLYILMEYWPYGLRSFGTDPEAFLRQMHGKGLEFMAMGKQGELQPVAFEKLLRTLAQKSFGRYSSMNLIMYTPPAAA